MYFRMLPDEVSGAVSYLLADLDAREAVLVDPRAVDLPVLLAMLAEQRLALRWVLRTHEHDGQLPRRERLVPDALGVPQVVHRVPAAPVLGFGSERVEVRATPGHTTGCLSFLWRDRLFCGDLLNVDACPFRRRPASPEAMWDSVMQQVFTLPDETLLFAAHALRGRVVGMVHEARRWHPWFGGVGRDEFLARVGPPGRARAAVPPGATGRLHR